MSCSAAGRGRGDPALVAAGYLGGAADLLADPEVGADRQLLLAPQRPGGVDHRGAADRLALLRHPDSEGGAGAVGEGDCNDAGAAAAAEARDQPGRLAAVGVDEEALDLPDRGAADPGDLGPEPADRLGRRDLANAL